jgi:hypothetical protein
MPNEAENLYHKASMAVDRYLEAHKGETFDLDTICRHMSISDAHKRDLITQKLSYEVRKGNLEKSNRLYRYIDNTYKVIDWVNVNDTPPIDLKFPVGADGSRFGFDGHVVISPKDIIIGAGLSNMGKTTLAHNLLWENMDAYHCTLMGNELDASKFKRRVSNMTWHDPLNEQGLPKFDLIERYDNWKDIIRPDDINIIDWINLNDNFYRIGSIIEGIKSKLDKGIAIIILQKDQNKTLGMGGGFSEHLSSLYLTIDFNRLTVRKLKEWRDINCNGKVFGFEIINHGTQFSNIRPLIKCHDCWGTGKKKGVECTNCNGSGWADVIIQTPKTDYINDTF